MSMKETIQTFRIAAGFESSYCWSQLRQHVVTVSMAKSSLHIPFPCGCKDQLEQKMGLAPNNMFNGGQSDLYLNK